MHVLRKLAGKVEVLDDRARDQSRNATRGVPMQRTHVNFTAQPRLRDRHGLSGALHLGTWPWIRSGTGPGNHRKSLARVLRDSYDNTCNYTKVYTRDQQNVIKVQ